MRELRKDLQYLIDKYGDIYRYLDDSWAKGMLIDLAFGKVPLSSVLYEFITLYFNNDDIVLDLMDNETKSIARKYSINIKES